MRLQAFDIIGDIAIVEINDGRNEKEIVESILKNHPHVKTIMKKQGEREGKFRTRKLKKIHGKDTVTEHKEHGCRFRMDVSKVYFSPREATERQRIAEQVKAKETVMVMFSGIGAFPVVIAKKAGAKIVYGIEINPDAHESAIENARINKVSGIVIPILGDVKKESKEYFGKCDRVVMPLPKEGFKFLPEAFKCLKKKGTIHFYFFEHNNELFTESVDIVKEVAKKMNKSVRFINKRKVLPYGPGSWKICIEFEVK